MTSKKNGPMIFLNVVLILYFSLFFAKKIILPTADLGRHLTNGKIFLETGTVLSTNYYSYTQPDYSFVNHHWFTGVIFYSIQKISGFYGLSIFYIILNGLAVYLFFKTAKSKSSFVIALLTTVLLLPLMSDRKEIRPEGISYLFLGLYLYLLTKYLEGKISKKTLYVTILITQLIWVNSHIFFIFGNFVIICFLLNELINKWYFKKRNYAKQLLILTFLSFIVSLANPQGLKGLLEPFNIFKEYGYMVIENQSVFFMQKRAPEFGYFYFEIMTILFFISTLYMLINKNLKNNIPIVMSTFTFVILSYRAIRMIPLFSFCLIILVSQIIGKYTKFKSKYLNIMAVLLISGSFIPGHFYSISKNGWGLGLAKGTEKAAEFFLQNNLMGPIFNNYDVGGYLIYYLYGKERVFVDNRPEAYSVDFFTNSYIPMQENENKWNELSSHYDFNVIFFYRKDATPWAQPFLIKRLQDSMWVPVYVDDYNLILLKNSDQNSSIIKEFKLPKNIFVIS